MLFTQHLVQTRRIRVELNLPKHKTNLCEEMSLQHYGILLIRKGLKCSKAVDRKHYL